MKKILSLIALLVVTFTAFAQSTSEKIIPDGTQPKGGTITPKAITVDWATQKIVANHYCPRKSVNICLNTL